MEVTEAFMLDNSVTMSAAVVPTHCPLEAANILLVGEWLGRVSQADSATFLGLLERPAHPDRRRDDETAEYARWWMPNCATDRLLELSTRWRVRYREPQSPAHCLVESGVRALGSCS